MSAQFSNISLYIPHVFSNYSKEDVTQVFEGLNLGKIKIIDFVSKMGQDGKEYNAAYVHFEYWNDTVSTRNFQARVLDTQKEARVVYDEPWYWIVLENKARKYVPGERKPRIDLGDFATPTKTDVLPAKTTVKVSSHREHLQMTPVKLEQNFESVAQLVKKPDLAPHDEKEKEEIDATLLEIQQEMEECEAAMEELDADLVNVDVRYLQTLEAENMELQNYIYQLNMHIQELNMRNQDLIMAHSNEQIKSQALAEAIQLVSKSKM